MWDPPDRGTSNVAASIPGSPADWEEGAKRTYRCNQFSNPALSNLASSVLGAACGRCRVLWKGSGSGSDGKGSFLSLSHSRCNLTVRPQSQQGPDSSCLAPLGLDLVCCPPSHGCEWPFARNRAPIRISVSASAACLRGTSLYALATARTPRNDTIAIARSPT